MSSRAQIGSATPIFVLERKSSLAQVLPHQRADRRAATCYNYCSFKY